jgi:hypothetical protein
MTDTEKRVLIEPTDKNNIEYVFPIIHENHIKQNGAFQQYLCNILDNKYTHHIFNTYIKVNHTILIYELNGQFTFFMLLALKPYWGLYTTFNSLYKKLSKDTNDKATYDFETEMGEIIDIFLEIFENPENKIMEDGSHTNKEEDGSHTNKEIIDLFLKNKIIDLPVYQGIGLAEGQTVEILMNYFKNDKMQNLYRKIKEQDTQTSTAEPGAAVETETTTSENTSDTGTTTDTILGTAIYNKLNTSTIHTGRRTTGYRRKTRGRHRHGGKYTKRMSNKGKSPVRQTKRIKLKRKTHKRRST